MPRVNQHMFDTEKKAIYILISQKIIDQVKTMPPFTDNYAFSSMRDDENLFGELSFPQPDIFGKKWQNGKVETLIFDRVNNLYEYHENLVRLPPIAASQGLYASELRFSGLIPGIVWSGRLDWIVLGGREIKVIDYKLTQPKLPPPNSWQHQVLQLAWWLTVQTVAQMPERFKNNSRSLRVIPKLSNPVAKNVHLIHLGFDSSPPSSLELSKYFQEVLKNPDCNRQMRTNLVNLLREINSQSIRLGPLLV